MAAVTAVLAAEGIAKRWGNTIALSEVTFSIPPGVTGLLGSNGAGKTTLLGMVLGLHRPDAGSLEVLGLDPAVAGPEVRQRLGYAPEHHNIPPDVRAHDFVRHLAEVHGLPRREATARASDALWMVGLGEERFRPMGTMSTGQRQRVKLAQALAHDPRLVLLDEPTDGLDPVQRDDMLALIGRVGRDLGIDVVLSSHLLDEVERICDNAVIIDDGRVVASGTITELVGDTGGLVLDVDGDAGSLVRALTEAGLVASAEGSTVRVAAQGDTDLLGITTDAVIRLDLGVRRLHSGRRSLEDVFLGVVR